MNPPSRPTSLLLCLLFLILSTITAPQAAKARQPPLSPQHTPIYSLTAGQSVPVSVTFEDSAEIAEVRLYFKTMAAEHYLFLPMAGRGTYTALLPPARNWTKGIDYLLLRKSIRGEIRKTKPFRLLVLDNFAYPPPDDGMQVEAEDSLAAGENSFAAPLRVTVTSDPLLAEAKEDPYAPIAVPEPGHGPGIFEGLGGMSFSLKIGGVSFRFGSFSGR